MPSRVGKGSYTPKPLTEPYVKLVPLSVFFTDKEHKEQPIPFVISPSNLLSLKSGKRTYGAILLIFCTHCPHGNLFVPEPPVFKAAVCHRHHAARHDRVDQPGYCG